MADNEPASIDPRTPIEFSLMLRAAEGVSATGWLANRDSRRVQTVLAETVLRPNERTTATVLPPFGRSLFTRLFVRGPNASEYQIETELRQPASDEDAAPRPPVARFEVSGLLSDGVTAEHVTELVGDEAPVQWAPTADSGAPVGRQITWVGKEDYGDDFALVQHRSSAALPETPPPRPEPQKEELAILNYTVWFGTHRTPVLRDDRIVDFGSGRSDIVRFGKCVVSIPRSHELGSIGSSPLRRWWTGKDDRLIVKGLSTIEEHVYWNEIQKLLENALESDKDVIVFLHGYRTTFKDAARRAAQLGADLGFNGIMAFYSWPSKGNWINYPADTATIESSEPAITSFLQKLALLAGARNIHIIAHSMGNRALLRAMNNIASAAQSQSKVPFNQIIIAAADVDLGTFKSLSAAYGAVARRTTMYVCPADLALYLSKAVYRFPRAGFTPPVVVVPGVDTVDVENVNLSRFGHGYFAEDRPLLADMLELFQHNTPPAKRFGLRPELGAAGVFWKFAK